MVKQPMASDTSSRKPSKPSGEWLAVESSHIVAVRYDGLPQALYVRFHDDIVYRYDPVMPVTFYGMLNALSIGKFFHHYIKGSYHCVLIEKGT